MPGTIPGVAHIFPHQDLFEVSYCGTGRWQPGEVNRPGKPQYHFCAGYEVIHRPSGHYVGVYSACGGKCCFALKADDFIDSLPGDERRAFNAILNEIRSLGCYDPGGKDW